MRKSLVICLRGSIPHQKYHPRNREKRWVVLEVTYEWVLIEGKSEEQCTTKTVYGPTNLFACNSYIVENQHVIVRETTRETEPVEGLC